MNATATQTLKFSDRMTRLGLLTEPAGYVDGNNLYEGYKGSPSNYNDPLGLRTGPDEPSTQPSTEDDEAIPPVTGKDAIKEKAVRDILDGIWEESHPDKDNSERREVATTIIKNKNGKILHIPHVYGEPGRASIDTGGHERGDFDTIKGVSIVVNAHTHPFDGSDRYPHPEQPSQHDIDRAIDNNVPSIIRHRNGYTIIETDGSVHHADLEGEIID